MPTEIESRAGTRWVNRDILSEFSSRETIHPHVAAAYDQLADAWRDDRFDQRNGCQHVARALACLQASRLRAGCLQAGEEGRALNVGAGCNTRFNGMLRAAGLELEAVDNSARMIALARAADPSVLLHHADISMWQPPRRYRIIIGWDSLWHIDLEQQADVHRKLITALEPGGVFLFTAGGLDTPNEHTDNYMGPRMYYATLGIPALRSLLVSGGCTIRQFEFDQYPEPHLVVIAVRGLGAIDPQAAAIAGCTYPEQICRSAH